jgi:hypothetical protein
MKKIRTGRYLYKGYCVIRIGYYPPDKSIWWEGVNELTNEADYHGHTKSEIKKMIDDDNVKLQKS